MRIVWALILFSVIILFHEFGHFLLAKLNHVAVLEFSLGMGPRIAGFVKGETRYSLKALPFGGSCVMLGEDAQEEGEGSFGSKSVWARISIVAAGPVFNFLMAYIFSVIIIAGVGIDKPVILSVSDGFPAQEAGLQEGDLITSVNGKKMHFYRDISDYIQYHQEELKAGETLVIRYQRDGESHETSLQAADNGQGRYVMGISGSMNYREKVSPGETLISGAYEVTYWIRAVIQGLKMMFGGQVKLDDLSGPVGVVDMIGETYEEASQDGAYYVWLNMLNIGILLSANLGVMNLLPLPALDGGRLLFLAAEVIRGRKVSQELEGRIHLIGLMILMGLMLLIMMNDVKKLFM